MEKNNNWLWNSVVNTIDIAFFVFAMSVVSTTVVVPAFMVRLGASAMLVALLPLALALGFRLPQIFVPFFIEGKPRLKRFITTISFFQRMPWAVIGLCAMWFAISSPRLVLAVLMAGLLATSVASGINYPAWSELMAKAIPEKHWGKTMGITHMLGNGLSVLGGIIVIFVMGQWPYPSNYAALFLIAGGLHYISHCFLCLNREPGPTAVHEKHENVMSYVRVLRDIITTDRSFFWFTVHQALGFSSIMGLGLFMVYAMKQFGATDAESGGFVLASTLTTLVASPLLGAAGDRHGHKSVIAISCAAYAASALCAVFGRSSWIMYPVFAVSALSVSAQMIGFRNLVYELAPRDRRPTYVALTSLLPAPFAVIFSVLGGWLAEHMPSGFTIVFVFSAVLNIAALAILVCLVHPRQAPEQGYSEEI